MSGVFEMENRDLAWSWDRYSSADLDSCWVSGVEDPRINCQSILTRALIADTLWPGEFTALIDAELRFGTVLTWLLRALERGRGRYEILDGLTDADDLSIPDVVRETFHWLQADDCPVQDYISAVLDEPGPDASALLACESGLHTFCTQWREVLQGRRADTIRLIEVGCGSANDFRFIHHCGLASFTQYMGIDVSTKAITNARRRFPDTDFRVMSILDSGLPDDSCDCLFAHDLLEHLSPQALERALTEAMRITQHELWLHLFNAGGQDEHIVRRVDRYHWNLLSVGRLSDVFERMGASVTVVSIPGMLARKFQLDTYHNPEATTMIVAKGSAAYS